MLAKYRQLHEQKADAILEEDWRKINKNQLFHRYVECENTNPVKAEAYIAAIIVRYWGVMTSYAMQGKNAYSVEDAYEWLLDVISYALREKPWINGKLKGDPNGPDKTINVCMLSRRQGFYQWSNAGKRADSFTQNISLDKQLEDLGELYLPSEDNRGNSEFYLDLVDEMQNIFKDKNYIKGFIIDGIINYPVFDKIKETGKLYFNKKKLSKHIRHIDDIYCKWFSKNYKLPYKEVVEAKNECVKLTSTKIYKKLDKTLEELSTSSLLFEI